MSARGVDLVTLRGAADFAHRQSAITVADARSPAGFVAFDERFVDEWSYVEISPSVKRPPTVAADTRWIAFQGGEVNRILPIPDRAIPPALPIDALTWPSTLPVNHARFLKPGNDGRTRVAVEYGDAAHRGPYTYTIDPEGRIAEVTNGPSAQTVTLRFAYDATRPEIIAPVDGVQRLRDGEDLCPLLSTTTTAA